MMTEAPDRLVTVAYHQPVLLFTDGSFELGFSGPFAGVGGVIFVPSCMFVAYFSDEIDEEYLQLLTADSANPIAIIELIAVVFAVTLWRCHLANISVLGFVDNDAASRATASTPRWPPWSRQHAMLRSTRGRSSTGRGFRHPRTSPMIRPEHVHQLDCWAGLKHVVFTMADTVLMLTLTEIVAIFRCVETVLADFMTISEWAEWPPRHRRVVFAQPAQRFSAVCSVFFRVACGTLLRSDSGSEVLKKTFPSGSECSDGDGIPIPAEIPENASQSLWEEMNGKMTETWDR